MVGDNCTDQLPLLLCLADGVARGMEIGSLPRSKTRRNCKCAPGFDHNTRYATRCSNADEGMRDTDEDNAERYDENLESPFLTWPLLLALTLWSMPMSCQTSLAVSILQAARVRPASKAEPTYTKVEATLEGSAIRSPGSSSSQKLRFYRT